MAKKKIDTTVPSFNMTPMIDVTFQLIIFFILAGSMASAELAQLLVPELHESQAQKPEDMPTNRVIVNIASAAVTEQDKSVVAQQAKEIQIGTKKFSPHQRDLIVAELKSARAHYRDKAPPKEKDQFFVEIRADYRVAYSEVEPVMLAAAEAEIPKMNITAMLAAVKQ